MASHVRIARKEANAASLRSSMRPALLMLLACMAGGAAAEDQVSATCVEVEIDGKRSLSTECLNDKLRPELSPESVQPHLPASEKAVSAPGNQLGLFNRAALSNRMGSNLGKSAHPQRPAETPQRPPLLQGR